MIIWYVIYQSESQYMYTKSRPYRRSIRDSTGLTVKSLRVLSGCAAGHRW